MKNFLRYTLAGIFLALMACCLGAALVSSAEKRNKTVCKRLSVIISDSLDNSFVSAKDIKGYLDRETGGYTGIRADSIDVAGIEKLIDRKSAVMKSEVFMTSDGTLNISVRQRKPFIRFQKKDGGFYADKDGFLFPLQDSYTAYVPVIDGAIPLNAESGYKGEVSGKEEKEWLDSMIGLVQYMNGSGIWAGNIVQITVLENGDLMMVPRIGKEKFLFGKPDNIADKFSRMGKYYTGIVPEKGEGYYSSVNVKYDNQIICKQ